MKMSSTNDKIISKKDVYDVYMDNKTSSYDVVVQELLFVHFGLVGIDVKKEHQTEWNHVFSQLKRKVRRCVENVKNTKSLKGLEREIFINTKDYPILNKIKAYVNPRVDDMSLSNDSKIGDTYSATSSSSNDFAYTGTIRKQLPCIDSKTQRRERLAPITNELKMIAEKENMPVEKLIALIGKNYCWSQHNYRTANAFKKIYDAKEMEDDNVLPIEKAIYIKEKSLLGKRQYTDLRLNLKEFIEFPSYDIIAAYIDQSIPPLLPSDDGFRFPVELVAKATLLRLPEDVTVKLMSEIQKNHNQVFIANFSGGVDGSGGHKVYNTKSFLSRNSDMSRYIVATMALTSISIDDGNQNIIHKVVNCCSSSNQRPICVKPGKETRSIIKDVFGSFNVGSIEGKKKQYVLDFGPFQASFKLNIKMKQIDTKIIKMVSGLGGAYCTCCNTSETSAHDIMKVSQGFEIDRHISEVKKLYDNISQEDEQGKKYIPKKTRDYGTRTGLSDEPLTNFDVCQNITVLHSYLNALDFVQKIIFCLNADVLKMNSNFCRVRFTPDEKKRFEDAKSRTQQKAMEMGPYLKLDLPSSTSGSSGTTNTGNVARTFFSAEKRQDIVDLLDDPTNKLMLADLLQKFSVILRILSSKETQINYSAFQDYCNDAYQTILINFKWVKIPGTIHRLLSHTPERIHANADVGLGSESEEGIETIHKMIRRIREFGARKMGLEENLRDTMKHLWIQSDPRIRVAGRPLRYQNQKNLENRFETVIPPNQRLFSADDEDILKKLFQGN